MDGSKDTVSRPDLCRRCAGEDGSINSTDLRLHSSSHQSNHSSRINIEGSTRIARRAGK